VAVKLPHAFRAVACPAGIPAASGSGSRRRGARPQGVI